MDRVARGEEGGWNAPLGLVGKRFPSSWAVAALENVAPLRRASRSYPRGGAVTTLACLAGERKAGRKPKPEIRIQTHQRGVRGLRTPCASSGVERRGEGRRF